MTTKYMHRAKGERFVMCTMRAGSTRTTGYIEESAAKKGTIVELVDLNEFVPDMWEVIEVGDRVVDSKVIKDIGEAHRGHRKVTDI